MEYNYGIFLTFGLNVRNVLQNIVSPAKHCYGSKQCYVVEGRQEMSDLLYIPEC